MSQKYFDYWLKKYSVECPQMDAFLDELRSVCRKYGIGFEMEGCGDGWGKLIPISFDRADFSIFYDHLDDYEGGVSWLDDAKRHSDQLRAAADEEYRRNKIAEQEQQERLTYERLRAKYEGEGK